MKMLQLINILGGDIVMINKLIKYDFKATSRYIMLSYIMLVFLTCFVTLMLHLKIYDGILSFLPSLLEITYFFAIIIFFIFNFVVNLMRFYSNLITEEGYQTFTLPADVNEIILSKLITSIVWTILSIISIGLSRWMVFYDVNGLFESINSSILLLSDVFKINPIIISLILVVMMIGTMSTYNLFMYTSIAFGQLSKKNKVLGTFISASILYMVIQVDIAALFYDCKNEYDSKYIKSKSSNDSIYIRNNRLK